MDDRVHSQMPLGRLIAWIEKLHNVTGMDTEKLDRVFVNIHDRQQQESHTLHPKLWNYSTRQILQECEYIVKTV